MKHAPIPNDLLQVGCVKKNCSFISNLASASNLFLVEIFMVLQTGRLFISFYVAIIEYVVHFLGSPPSIYESNMPSLFHHHNAWVL